MLDLDALADADRALSGFRPDAPLRPVPAQAQAQAPAREARRAGVCPYASQATERAA